jgi:DNA-binding transcriptional ArsR family regulator
MPIRASVPAPAHSTFAASDRDLEQLTAIFRLLSDSTRLNILMVLADGEKNVTSLCEELKLPQPTVSHHLGLLRMHNVIANRRHGKHVFYTLNGRVNVGDDSAVRIGVQNFNVLIMSKAVARSALAG